MKGDIRMHPKVLQEVKKEAEHIVGKHQKDSSTNPNVNVWIYTVDPHLFAIDVKEYIKNNLMLKIVEDWEILNNGIREVRFVKKN